MYSRLKCWWWGRTPRNYNLNIRAIKTCGSQRITLYMNSKSGQLLSDGFNGTYITGMLWDSIDPSFFSSQCKQELWPTETIFAQLDPKTEQLEFQQMLMLRIDAAVTPTFSSRFLPPMLPTQMMRMLLPPQILMMRMPLLLQTQMVMMRMPLVIATIWAPISTESSRLFHFFTHLGMKNSNWSRRWWWWEWWW